MSGDKFKQLDVINEYDVGIIHTASRCLPIPTPKRAVTLKPATDDYVESLKPGGAVAAIGFPIEGMTATMVVERCASHAAFRQYQLFDRHVHVPGQRCRRPAAHSAHRSGHRRDERKSADRQEWRCDRHHQRRQYRKRGQRGHGQQEAVGQGQCRDRQECASRAPLWSILRSESICSKACTAERPIGIADDWSYWEQAAKRYVKYFENAADQLTDLAKEHYGVADTTREKVGEGTLKPSRSGRRHTTRRAIASPWRRVMSTASSPTARAAFRSRSTSRDRARLSFSETSLFPRKPRVLSRLRSRRRPG